MATIDKNYNKIIAKRKRRSTKRKFFLFLRILGIIIFFGIVIWGLNYLYNSNYFKISEISISGNLHYTDEEIQENSEIDRNINIFEVDKKLIEDRLKERLIWIKEINLKKIFPDKIDIEVTERKPFIIAAYSKNQYLLDKEGIVLGLIGQEGINDIPGLLLVKDALDFDPEVGEKIAKKNILACGQIFGILDLEIKNKIKEAVIDNNFSKDIIFITMDDKKIIFGNSDKIIDKNLILSEIMDQLEKNADSYSVIDLRNINDPIIN